MVTVSRQNQRVAAMLLVSGLLVACASGGGGPRQQSTYASPERAEQQATAGRHKESARLYFSLADQGSGASADQYRLAGVEQLLLFARGGPAASSGGRGSLSLYTPAEALGDARARYDQISPTSLSGESNVDYRLIGATLLLAEQRPLEANAILSGMQDIPEAELPRFHLLRGEAAFKSGSPLAGLLAFQSRDAILPLAERDQNRRLLWQNLQSAQLDLIGDEPLDKESAGWIALAEIAQNAWAGADEYRGQLYDWRRSYPLHPATKSIFPELQSASASRSDFPETVGVVLPFSGRYAPLAGSVRDGLMAAWHELPDSRRPQLKFYDSGAVADAAGLYDVAVADGASFVIGPLTKEAVGDLLSRPDLPVPAVALNHIGDAAASRNVWQFGLSPEDEAREVAKRAGLDGHRSAIVLVPSNEWGKRVSQAFSDQFREFGGELADIQFYDPSVSDFTDPITRALSNSLRWFRLRNPGVPLPPSLEPGAKAGDTIAFAADFAFLGAFPRQARLIRPQLRFHKATALPVYSTSHAYSGTPDPRRDIDLNGLRFCDIAWVADPDRAEERDMVQELWPTRFERHARLFALGFDALRLAPLLLSQDDMGLMPTMPGASGRLRFDEQGVIHRELLWAEIYRGEPRPLPSAALNRFGSGDSIGSDGLRL